MSKEFKYSQQFKEDAAQYKKDYPELTICKDAENLGVSESAFKHWLLAASGYKGVVPTRGSGNDASETPSFCQRDTEKTKRFTLRLPCMEKTCPIPYRTLTHRFKRKGSSNI